jgi:glutaconate CoA-transferase subunit A
MSSAETSTLAEAIAANVKPGDSVYITGFTHLIGFAAAHEIIRQGIRDLTLIRLTPDLVYDQMVAAGCARKLVFSYLGNPGVGSLNAIRRAIERGEIEWEEYTHGSLIAALRAGAQGAPFAPVPAVAGTDLPRHNPAIATVRSPFDGTEVPVVAPLRPDVAIVHAQRADAQGRVQVWGSVGDIPEAARAARRVIVTAEEIVDEEALRADPNRTLLLGRGVEAVVHVPYGAHPSYAQGLYGRDNRFYRQWAEISADPDDLDSYLEEQVRSIGGWDAHVERERERLNELSKVGESVPNAVNFGDNAAIAAVQE